MQRKSKYRLISMGLYVIENALPKDLIRPSKLFKTLYSKLISWCISGYKHTILNLNIIILLHVVIIIYEIMTVLKFCGKISQYVREYNQIKFPL